MAPKLHLIDTRASRIDALRARVRAGTYRVDVRALSVALLCDPTARALLGLHARAPVRAQSSA